MAKKKLHTLMDGLIGLPDEQTRSTPPISNVSDANASATVKTVPTTSKATSDEDVRTTIIVPASLVKKIKFISVLDERSQKDIITEVLSEYVKRWESENGSIPLKK